jgi:hypothetical protein
VQKIKAFLKNSLIKPLDLIIILFLILLSFLPIGIFAYQQAQSENTKQWAQLSVDGNEIKQFDLSKNTTYQYKAKDGDWNNIVVKDKKIRITSANCNDQICVRRGWINKPGQTIVCLPHKLVIEIISSDGNQDGSVIY